MRFNSRSLIITHPMSNLPLLIAHCSFEQKSDIPALHKGDIIALRWILKGRCDGFRYLSFIRSSPKASVGVRHPRHFLGVAFKRSQIDFIS
jgi:hypothetical protein